jgi:hypothetical protein
MLRYILLIAVSFTSLVSSHATVLELQQQPTFPFFGIGWRYEKPPYPPVEEIIALPATERPVYGLYCWGGEYVKYNRQIHEIGWTNFRFSGPMNDDYMRAYASDGVEVMATLAARLHGSFKPEAPMSDWRNRADYDSDEAFIADYIGGTCRWLERWGPEGSFFRENPDVPHNPIRLIEIFNEPNFWYLDASKEQHRDRMKNGLSAQERLAIEDRRERLYARLLVAVREAVNERWPDVRVVGFAAGGSAMADVRFIKNVHAADKQVAESYDILSTHPYVTRACAPEGIVMRSWGEYSIAGNLAAIRDTMEAHGTADRPIWYTEHGWAVNLRSGGSFVDPIRPPDDGVTAAATSLDGIPYDIDPRKWVDPLTQAAYHVRMYAQCLRMGIERHFPMSIVDTDGFNSGFLQKDGSLRSSARAVQNMISLMPHPKLIEVISDGENGVFIYRFDPDVKDPESTPVTMAWSIELNKYSIPVLDSDDALFRAGPVLALGMLGKNTVIKPSGQPIRAAIGPVPLFLLPQADK